MVVLWLTLLFLQEGYTMPRVTSVQLGEPAILTCVSPDMLSGRLFWYKQRAGETLTLIVRLQTHINPVFGAEFSPSRYDVNIIKTMSNLTILKTIEEDEGMYHCGVSDWIEVDWSGTYLSLTGNSQRTSNLTVVQQPSVIESVRPGALVSLQCSVLSDSESKTCPGGHSVFWLRARSDKSYPDIIYTDQNRRDECDKRSDAQKSCVYHFSKNVSSSDAGTYYCAVAACGRILFGDGSKVQIEQTASPELTGLVITMVCLVISVIVNVFTCFQKPRDECKGDKAPVDLRFYRGAQFHQQMDDGTKLYSAVVFTMMKSESGTAKDSTAVAERRVCAALKAFGLRY
ncbi:uncharacterized protein LOC141793716 [Halichoeres trimaculatus]|uniref:uncharacterized protein LOC141793716 n=1 Tax=Halichoeres trimaculatus TaxID=147232 RepID=UPI003D9F7096